MQAFSFNLIAFRMFVFLTGFALILVSCISRFSTKQHNSDFKGVKCVVYLCSVCTVYQHFNFPYSK